MKLYHNKRFSEDDIVRAKAKKYYSINKYLNKRFLEIVSKNANNKNLLQTVVKGTTVTIT